MTASPFFSLFIAPRWDREGEAISEIARGGASVVAWMDGPLAVAIVTREPQQAARGLAETVRDGMRTTGEAPTASGVVSARPVISEIEAIADTLAAPVADAPQASPASSPAVVQPN